MSTTLGTAVGPTYRLDGPLPILRKGTLLDIAQQVTSLDLHWLNGAWLQSYLAGEAAVYEPCTTGTDASKPDGAAWSDAKFAAFQVNQAVTCNAGRIGPDPRDWFLTHLIPAFKAVEAQQVERAFASGAFVEVFGEVNPHLTDANLDKLNGGVAVSPLEGLALLEDAIGESGRGGIIHATPATVTLWGSGSRLYLDGAKTLRTMATDTPIVVGAGYIGAFPDDGTAPGAHEAWAFATWGVRYLADPPYGTDPITIPDIDEYRQAIDTSTNEVTWRVERNYLIAFDSDTTDGDNPPLQAGVLIDRTNVTP